MDTQTCYSEYRLERYHLDLFPKEEKECMTAHIENCTQCQHNLQTIAKSWQEEHSSQPIPKTPEATTSMFAFVRWSWALSLVLVVGLGFISWRSLRPHPQSNKTLSIKGTHVPKIYVAHQHEGQVKQAHSGDTFINGSALRLAYKWGKSGFLLVWHQDNKGNITPIYPSEASQPGLYLTANKTQLLPGSLLVEGPSDGPEWIWSCFSHKALSHQDIRQEQHKTHHKQLSRTEQCTYLIRFVMNRPS